jgi:hypothetical protein
MTEWLSPERAAMPRWKRWLLVTPVETSAPYRDPKHFSIVFLVPWSILISLWAALAMSMLYAWLH